MLGEEFYRAWGELLYTVKTGKPVFDQVYDMKRFEYLDRHPDVADVFNTAMVGLFRRAHRRREGLFVRRVLQDRRYRRRKWLPDLPDPEGQP